MKQQNMKSQNGSITKGQVLNLIRSQRMANAELKGYVTTSTGNSAATTGAVYNITNGIIVGDLTTQRDGSQINLNRVGMRFETSCVGVSGVTRVMIFQDKQNNGSTPVTTDVLDSATYISGHNTLTVDTQQRYKILLDKTLRPSITGEQIELITHTFSKSLLKKVTYLATTAIAGANGRNALFMLVIGNSTNVFDYSFRVLYIDQ